MEQNTENTHSLWAEIGIGLGIGTIITAGCVAGLAGSTAIMQYDADVQQNQITITRPTSLFEHVKFTRYTSSYRGTLEDELFHSKFIGESKFFNDGFPYGPHDCKVDYISNPDTSTALDRLKDYSANKKEFDQADKFMAEMKESFKEYL